MADSGLMDYKARAYDPFLQKFIQPDTVVAEPGSSQGYNRYAYVNNDPVNLTDPSGNKACEEIDKNGKCIVDADWENNKLNIPLPQSISESGKGFIENAEGLYGVNNQALYNDIYGNCTIGYGSLIANNTCDWAETAGKRFYTQDGLYYVLDRWENQSFLLTNVSRHPIINPIWALSDDKAEEMMDIELDHQAAMISSALTVTLNQNQWDAVQSFVYQTGATERIVNELNTAPFSSVADWIRNYGKDPKTGLYPFLAYGYRRNQEADLFLFGDYDYSK